MKSKHATIAINDSVWTELEEPFDVLYWSIYSDVAIYVQEYGISGWGSSISVPAETSYSVNTSVQKIRVKSQVGNADVNYSLLGFIVFRIGGQLPNVRPITTKTGDYTIVDTDFTVLVDASISAVVITLLVNPVKGQIFNIKCIDDSNTVTIDRNGKTIDGIASDLILIRDESTSLQYDGVGWRII